MKVTSETTLDEYLKETLEEIKRDPEAAKKRAKDMLLQAGIIEIVDGKIVVKQLIKD